MGNILVVDDDSGIRKSIAFVLRQDRHEVIEACTGKEALGIIGQKYFDLVISDLRLPEVDGLTLLERIKEKDPSTTVIIITSYGTLKTAVEAGKRGAFDFINKDFSMKDLKAKVNEVLEANKVLKNQRIPKNDLKEKRRENIEYQLKEKEDKEKYPHIFNTFNTIEKKEEKSKLISLINKLASEVSLKEYEINKMILEISDIYEELSLFYKISKSFGSLHDIHKIYEVALSSSVRQIHVKKGMIGIVEKGNNLIDIENTVGFKEDLASSYTIQGSYFEEAIFNKKPIIDNQANKHKDKYLGLADNNSLIVPFMISNKEVGFFCLFDKIEDEFSLRDMKAIATITCQCSISIERITYYQEFQTLLFDTIRALSSAIDTKDKYTYEHSYRVTKYALILVNKLNLSNEEKNKTYLAGLLHDIGKIGTPVEILHKPGALSYEEFEVVKQHPLQSVNIVKSVKKLTDILSLILGHHERFDGNGYPQGLKGEDIPLISRILGLADAFDAMTSDRPYRKRMSLEEALFQLQSCSEKQFDPHLVEIFLQSSAEVEKLYNSFQKEGASLVSS